MALSKEEKESIETTSEPQIQTPAPRSNKKIIIYLSVIGVVVLIFGGISFSYINTLKPAVLDGFAQCLTEKGAIMYGATSCQYSHAQQGMFGNSKKYLDIRDFTEDSNVRATPTWLINDNYYPNVQTLDRLSFLTGCKI